MTDPPPYLLDEDVAAFVTRTEAFYEASLRNPTLAQSRADYDRMAAAYARPYPDGVSITDGFFCARNPERELPWRRYVPHAAHAECSVLYLHGGGFVLGGLDSHASICADLAAASGVAILTLDYRLSPEHLYPAALDDVEAAFDALTASGERVIVAGDSAGGTLGAALCLRLRRLGKTMPIGQVLIYPALHPDAGRAAGTWRATVPMLTTADMLEYRRLYTGRSVMQTTDDPELAPLAALDFRFLPEAAVFAADIDPLAEDSADYVAALRAAGVPATLDEGRGLTHGYVRGRYDGARMAQAFAAIAGAVRRMAQGRTQGRG